MRRTSIHHPGVLPVLFAVAILAAGLLALAEAKPVSAEPLSFSPAPGSPFTVGSTPTTVTSADFNGDGKMDLAAQNAGSNSVSVLLGMGDGDFQAAPKSPFAVGSTPSSVTSADFNGDGKMDLAVSNQNSRNVSVLLGNGEGDFQKATNSPFTVGGQSWAEPSSVASADFNGDQKADLAVANLESHDVSVLLGNGDGNFQVAKNFSMGSNPNQVISADFNGDGKADLATANWGRCYPLPSCSQLDVAGGFSVRLGDGTGNFQSSFTHELEHTYSITSEDFNSDGKMDLVVPQYRSKRVWVYLNKGDGTFVNSQIVVTLLDANPVAVASADFDSDDKSDLAVTSFTSATSDNVSVLFGNDDGSFQAAQNFPTGNGPVFAIGENLNADSYADLALANQDSNDVSVLLNTAPAPDTTAPTISSISPAETATGVAVSANVSATFSEAMNKASVEAPGTFTLEQGTSPVSAAVTYDTATRKATLDPNSDLAWNTTYTATIKGGSGGAEDTANNALERDYSWTFSTASDTTAPSTTRTLSPAPNAAGWNNSNVTVTLNATDAGGSGVKEISYSASGAQQIPGTTVPGGSTTVNINTEGTTTISYFATDKAGNRETPAKTVTVSLDETAPQVAPGDLVNNVWRNSPLSAEFTASDGGSGLANSADAGFTLTASEESAGANQPTVASRTVSDAAGNSTTRKVSALIDLRGPQTTAASKPLPNTAGWNDSNVTVTLNATDTGGSGISEIHYSATGAQSIAETVYSTQNPPVINVEGTTTISYFATDEAGNKETSKSLTLKLDESAPTLDTDNSDGSDGITPDDEQAGVSRDVEPTATFSDEMDRASLSASAKLYQWNARKHEWQAVPVAASVVGETATLNPYPSDSSRQLAANKRFKVTITTGAENLAGISLSSNKSWMFTTGSR